MACRACPGAWCLVVAAGIAAVGVGFGQPADKKAPEAKQPEKKAEEKVDAYVLGFRLKDIDGKEVDLERYKGKVVVMVNVASQCGYTPQYEGLERLYQEKKDKGLVVLGFPADNFGHQEPGTSEEIKTFCASRFHVTFPMFEKIGVVGEEGAKSAKEKGRPVTGGPPSQHPLYAKLSAQGEPIGGDPRWNFTKFVVDREGKVVARFDAKAKGGALEADLLKKVDELLADDGGKKEKKPAAQSGS